VEEVIQIEDDLLVHGKTQEQQDGHLHAILNRMKELGVTLQKEKWVWLV